jgi:hypothetical protein
MKFKSKVDWWMWVIFYVAAATTIRLTYLALTDHRNAVNVWAVAVMWVCEFAILIPIFLRTYYILESDALYIFCWFSKERIPYSQIISLKETRNPLASAALSIDRIEIKYRTKTWTSTIMISPKSKQDFIRLLEERLK